MKSKLILGLILVFFIFSSPGVLSQVTVGSNLPPNSGAILDLKEKNNPAGETASRGLVLPRVNLEKIDQLFPMFGNVDDVDVEYESGKSTIDPKHVGLIVYNLTENLEEGLCPGVYSWTGDGTQHYWVRLPEPCPKPLALENSPNSYFVKPGETLLIPLGKPYILGEERADLPNISLTSKASVELLWQDTQSLVSAVELEGENNGPYSVMKVTANAGVSGNALVAVRMGANGNQTDPIVWSWHVWVTDYDPNSGGTTYAHNNGEKDYVFMDRNLGATTVVTSDVNAMGLTYQWGRKDPFTADSYFYDRAYPRKLYNASNNEMIEVNELDPANPTGSGIQHKEVVVNNNLANSVANPMVFYYGAFNKDYLNGEENPADWLAPDATGVSSNDNLWLASGNKSPFDPCPKGWRVPSGSTSRSPWYHFESGSDDGEEEIGGGWGGPPGSGGSVSGPAEDLNTGLGFNNVAGATNLGFYPFGIFRTPGVSVYGDFTGSAAYYTVGGAFIGSGQDGQRFAAYWTADAVGGDVRAKAELFEPNVMNEVKVVQKNRPRATGAFVRCVKDNNSAGSPY